MVLVTVLEETRRLLKVSSCSIWLIDAQTGEMVCQHVSDPQHEALRGWRLAPDQGIIGWIARHGQSQIVPDTRLDERHFRDVGQKLESEIRSILGVPLRVKQTTIGVIEAVDTEKRRFSVSDLQLLELLAAAAASAIENAQLYTGHKQAEEALRRAHDELETRVQERTAELAQANEALRIEITERVRAEETLRWYVNRLRTLHEIAGDLLAAQSPQAIAQAALQRIGQLIPCQRGSVVVFDLKAYEATILATHVASETDVGAGARLPVEALPPS